MCSNQGQASVKGLVRYVSGYKSVRDGIEDCALLRQTQKQFGRGIVAGVLAHNWTERVRRTAVLMLRPLGSFLDFNSFHISDTQRNPIVPQRSHESSNKNHLLCSCNVFARAK